MKGAEMVADFYAGKADLKKVSKSVQDFVANVAKTEGNKKKIDSDAEFTRLSMYLAGNGNSMNKDELCYVQGFMLEYQNKKFDDSTTENTKKEVSKIAKRMGNKKKIDSDEEAQALATMLRNSHHELNSADLAYIQNLLILNGYGHYLQQQNPNFAVVNVTVEQKTENDTPEKFEKKTNDNIKCEQKETPEPKRELRQKIYPKRSSRVEKEVNRAGQEADRAEVEANRSKAEADRSKAEADRSKKEADRSEAEANKAKVNANRAKAEADKITNAPKVKEADRTKGFGIANKIHEELHDFWTNDSKIQDELWNVNYRNAYSFIGKMAAISDDRKIFGSFYKRVSSRDVGHVVTCLLRQAESLHLENDIAYKNLNDTYKFLKRRYISKDPTSSISDRRDVEELDIQIKHLYNVMSKVYK